jgi:hypothetical protein
MSLSIVVNGGGTFTASMEEGPVSFTASLAAVGPQGPAGPGVAVGGTTGLVLAKASATNYDTEWVARNPFDQELNTTDAVTFANVSTASNGNVSIGTSGTSLSSDLLGIGGFATLGQTSLLLTDGTDSLSVDLSSGVTFPDSTFQTTALPSGIADGYIVSWDEDTATYLSVPNDARTLFITARNITGTTIPKGSVVLITGASGNRPTIGLAQGDTGANADGVIGITDAAIDNNANGRVITEGLADNLDTSAFAAGDKLYLSAVTPGGLVNVRPVQPAHSVAVGVVTRSNNAVGSIEVRVQVGEHLEFLHDVLLTSNTNLDLLSYETSSGLWKNKSFSTLGLLTSATAASTYAPLASPTFTGTVTIPAGASISGFAPLASPVFTGVPEAPTAAATTNTTQVATTAFVQQEVPAASTSAAGKVELATDAEAVAGTSTTLAVVPKSLHALVLSRSLRFYTGLDLASTGTSSGSTGISANGIEVGLSATTSGAFALRALASSNAAPQSLGTARGVINFSKPTWIGTRILRQGTLDDNAVIRLSIGKIFADSKGDLTRLGFGWTIRGTGAFETQGFMGATLTKSTNGTTGLASTNAVDIVVYSDGTGNLTLFVNGTQTASSTGGPTGSSDSTANVLMFEIENVALATATSTASCGQLYILQAD